MGDFRLGVSKKRDFIIGGKERGIQRREILRLNSIFSTFHYRPRTIGSVATDITTMLKMILNIKKTSDVQYICPK